MVNRGFSPVVGNFMEGIGTYYFNGYTEYFE